MAVSYIVKRSRKRRKTISLQVGRSAELIVSAPYFTPEVEINRFVQEKQNWIEKTIQKQKTAFIHSKQINFVSGEFFYYLGIPYPLEVFFQQNLPAGLVFWGNRFYLNCADGSEKRRNYFIAWYKTKFREYITRRVDDFSNQLKLWPRNIKITSAQTRWGSCSEDNNLAFSWRLMMALPVVIDYVVIHELMHIKEKNHSAAFWKLVATIAPQYKTHRRWLKENASIFIL